MAHLHLPAEHDDRDLAMAGALARALRSRVLYVTWSRAAGRGRPVVPAEVRDEPRRRGRRRRRRP